MTQHYEQLRQELRAFHPEECHQLCRDPKENSGVCPLNC